MDEMMQAFVDKTESATFESVDFEVPLRHTLENIVSSPLCLFKVTEVLLKTDAFLEQVTQLVSTEAYSVLDFSWKREK